MIKSEKIFNSSELETILSYTQKYTELYATPSDEIVNIEENRVEYSFEDWSKKFKCINLPRNEETNWLFQKLLDWFTSATGVTTKNYTDSPVEAPIKELLLTIQGYSEGDRFDRHIDIQPGVYSTRRYNVGVQLNDNYEGGEFVVWNEKEEEILIPKEAGTAVAYDIRFWHQIKPITSGTRWSIVFPILKNFITSKRLL